VWVGVGLLARQGAVPQLVPLEKMPVSPQKPLQEFWFPMLFWHDPLVGQRQQPGAAAAVFGALSSAPKLRTRENKATATMLDVFIKCLRF
jgi:hypothetical protein